MPTIIDGNNLIGSSPDISLDDPAAREKMLHMVKTYQESKNGNIIIVFDGKPESIYYNDNSAEKFSVVYPRYGCSADEEIKEILNGYSDFKSVKLVSSDRDLKIFAKSKGAKTINSIEFYFELKRVYRLNGKKEEKLRRIHNKISKQEVDQWLKIFEND
ncbi:MAG: NYN domain-containing protein [Candidatus Aminicenantes bacterium]|nr:NYN domain-containing protein [Candidatus Aminicenantes bacterium]